MIGKTVISAEELARLEGILNNAIDHASSISKIYLKIRINRDENNIYIANYLSFSNLEESKPVYEKMKNVLEKLKLIEKNSEESESLWVSVKITHEALSDAIIQYGSFHKLIAVLIDEMEVIAQDPLLSRKKKDVQFYVQINKFAQFLGISSDDLQYGGDYNLNLYLLFSDFRQYLETLSEDNRICLDPILEGFDNIYFQRMIHGNNNTIREGFTPLPFNFLSQVEGSLEPHAVGFGLFKKGNSLFLIYTNTGADSTVNSGSFIFEIDPQKIKCLFDDNHKNNFKSFFINYESHYKSDISTLKNYDHIKEMLTRYFLTTEQLNLITEDKPFPDDMALNKEKGLYAIDSARTIYQYSKPQKWGNCSVSNTRKQKKSDIALCLISRDEQILNYNILKNRFSDEGLQNKINDLYKSFTQQYHRDNMLEELFKFISLIYTIPTKYTFEMKEKKLQISSKAELDKIKSKLEYMIAFYMFEHRESEKDASRIKRMNEMLKSEFAKPEYDGFADQVYQIYAKVNAFVSMRDGDLTSHKVDILNAIHELNTVEHPRIDVHFIHNGQTFLSCLLQCDDPEINNDQVLSRILNSKHFDPWKILMYEIGKGNKSLINLLLKQKMNVDKCDENGICLIDKAIKYYEQEPEILQELLKAGAIISKRTLDLAKNNTTVFNLLKDEQQKRENNPKSQSEQIEVPKVEFGEALKSEQGQLKRGAQEGPQLLIRRGYFSPQKGTLKKQTAKDVKAPRVKRPKET